MNAVGPGRCGSTCQQYTATAVENRWHSTNAGTEVAEPRAGAARGLEPRVGWHSLAQAASEKAATDMAITDRTTPLRTALSGVPRFRFGSLAAWRAAFLASLGWGAAACSGDVESQLPQHLQCQDDEPISGERGLWRCSNGIVHRPEVADDSSESSGRDQCASDADCADGALCVQSTEIVSVSDVCGTTLAQVGGQYFACQTRADSCGDGLQCPAAICGLHDGARSCFGGENPFACGVPGRPFLVGAEIRRASLRAGAGWCDESAARVDDLDDSQRARVARHYEQAALLEHASIAAFARFTLQLLELGAPADLCSGAQEAMVDETSHARLCFTLASRYAGHAIEPGPLSMSGALGRSSLDDVARLCLLEGCVGETLAALEAAEALAGASDPDVRLALERIAHDERRHAELAFRFVAWALEQGSTTASAAASRRALAAVLDATVAASRAGADKVSDDVSSDEAALARHGVLSERRRGTLRRAALEEVVVPCVRQLLSQPEGRRPEAPAHLAASATNGALSQHDTA